MYVKNLNVSEKPNFLASAHFVTQTYQLDLDYVAVEEVNGRKIALAGSPYPANDATCIGLLFSDVDITEGPQPASVMVEGWVNEARLPVALDEAAKTALTQNTQISFKKFI